MTFEERLAMEQVELGEKEVDQKSLAKKISDLKAVPVSAKKRRV